MSHHSQHGGSGLKPHLKWTLILGAVLALLAMGAYVLTMDEAVTPGQPTQAPTPAAP